MFLRITRWTRDRQLLSTGRELTAHYSRICVCMCMCVYVHVCVWVCECVFAGWREGRGIHRRAPDAAYVRRCARGGGDLLR